MSKVIGIASEGPTDFLVLKAVIDKITGQDNIYRHLQPEQDMLGRYGNGWKGVWKWCKETESIESLMKGIYPNIDIIVVQIDADVSRKEKEVHCKCESTNCNESEDTFPLYCEKAKDACPIVMPCKSHKGNPDDYRKHLEVLLRNEIDCKDKDKIIITIPADSTDAWIVAAYDMLDDVENIEDPWRNIIANGKYYHGVRIRGIKKSGATYLKFVDKIADNWDVVTEKCQSAKVLEEDIKRALIS